MTKEILSGKQLEANGGNAPKSAGPRTAGSKLGTPNALKHGHFVRGCRHRNSAGKQRRAVYVLSLAKMPLIGTNKKRCLAKKRRITEPSHLSVLLHAIGDGEKPAGRRRNAEKPFHG